MNGLSYYIIEVLNEQRERELASQEQRMLIEAELDRERRAGVRRSLAAGLVRLGLRLDPAAGEGLGPFKLAPAHDGGRPQ